MTQMTSQAAILRRRHSEKAKPQQSAYFQWLILNFSDPLESEGFARHTAKGGGDSAERGTDRKML